MKADESKIKKKDLLSVTVSSLSREMDERFNAGAPIGSGQGAGSNPFGRGYMVDDEGSILLHHLGKVQVDGLTRAQLRDKLQQDLTPFMKEPIVAVQYLNHKVTVLGAVRIPQVLNMPEEHLSLIDVIVSSGDLTDAANRKDIMLIRESGNEKVVKHLNLEDNSIFTSPYYYVQPNDVIYVLPENDKYNREERRRSLQTTLSFIASGVSLIVIVLNLLLR